MKKLSDYKGYLTDYSEDEQKDILLLFINSIILDLNVTLTNEHLEHIKSRLYERINSWIFIGSLVKIHKEITGNYKKYLPFCFASILTARRTLDNELPG